MNKFDTFTNYQKETYTLIHNLEEEYMKAFDPAFFVLNDKLQAVRAKITKAQDECNHIFEDGVCIVCHKEEVEANK